MTETVSSKKSLRIYLEAASEIFIIILLRRRQRQEQEQEGERTKTTSTPRGKAIFLPACALSYSFVFDRRQSPQVSGLDCLHKTRIQTHSVRVCLSETFLLLFILFFPLLVLMKYSYCFLFSLLSNTFLSRCMKSFWAILSSFQYCWKDGLK